MPITVSNALMGLTEEDSRVSVHELLVDVEHVGSRCERPFPVQLDLSHEATNAVIRACQRQKKEQAYKVFQLISRTRKDLKASVKSRS